MSHSPEPSLRTRIDGCSYQVSSDADPRFWFRLERQADHDVITDYFLGSFPRERAAGLLGDCYRLLGLTPRRSLVFRDIIPTKGPAPDDRALDDVRGLYLEAGTALLTESGARRVTNTLILDRSKSHLILVGD